jgi:hypothetical protein
MIASIPQRGSTVIKGGREEGNPMAPRVDSDLLLVGSLPADSADSALRAAAEFFGDLVFALPDGETGPRAAWVGYERERLVRPNPGVVVVQETESPTGIPRHAYETPVFGIAPGVTELRWDSWPRIDDAIAGAAQNTTNAQAQRNSQRPRGHASLRRSRYVASPRVSATQAYSTAKPAHGASG